MCRAPPMNRAFECAFFFYLPSAFPEQKSYLTSAGRFLSYQYDLVHSLHISQIAVALYCTASSSHA